MIITMGGEREAQMMALFDHPFLQQHFEPPVFSPGIPSRSLRNRNQCLKYAHMAGLIPDGPEWTALEQAANDPQYQGTQADRFFECLQDIPVASGRRGSQQDVQVHFSCELWRKAKSLNRGRAVLACVLAHLIAIRQFVASATWMFCLRIMSDSRYKTALSEYGKVWLPVKSGAKAKVFPVIFVTLASWDQRQICNGCTSRTCRRRPFKETNLWQNDQSIPSFPFPRRKTLNNTWLLEKMLPRTVPAKGSTVSSATPTQVAIRFGVVMATGFPARATRPSLRSSEMMSEQCCGKASEIDVIVSSRSTRYCLDSSCRFLDPTPSIYLHIQLYFVLPCLPVRFTRNGILNFARVQTLNSRRLASVGRIYRSPRQRRQ